MNISINLTKSPDGSICPSFTVTPGDDAAKPFTLTPEGAQATTPIVTSVDATLPLRSTSSASPALTAAGITGPGIRRTVTKLAVLFKDVHPTHERCVGELLQCAKTASGNDYYITLEKQGFWNRATGKFERYLDDSATLPASMRLHLDLRAVEDKKPARFVQTLVLPTYSGVVLPGVSDRNQESPKPTTGYQGPGRYVTVGGYSVTIEKLGDNGRCYGSVSFDEGSGFKTVRTSWWAGNGIFDRYTGVLEGFVPRREHLRLSTYLGSQPVVDDLTRFPGPGVYKTIDGKDVRITRRFVDEWVGTVQFPRPGVAGGHVDSRAFWTLEGKFVWFWWEHPDGKLSARKELDLVRYDGPLGDEPSALPQRGPVAITGPGTYKTAEGTTVTFEPLKPGKTASVRWGDIGYPKDSTAPRRGCWEARTGEFIRFVGKTISDANARRHRLQLVAYVARSGVDGQKATVTPKPQPYEPSERVGIDGPGLYETHSGERVRMDIISNQLECSFGEVFQLDGDGMPRVETTRYGVWNSKTGEFLRYQHEQYSDKIEYRPGLWLVKKISALPGESPRPSQPTGGTAVEELEKQRVPQPPIVSFHEANLNRLEGAELVKCAKEDVGDDRSVEVWKIKDKDAYCVRIFGPTNDGKTAKLSFGLTAEASEALLRALSRHLRIAPRSTEL